MTTGQLRLRLMDAALKEAHAAGQRGEVPVGALVVSNGVILARAGNRVQEQCDPTAHAEMIALRCAGGKRGVARLPDCDLYVSLEPCVLCAWAISLFRIRRLYFAAYDPKGGAVEHGPCLFSQKFCHHKPEIYGGIGEARAVLLLRNFFAEQRAVKRNLVEQRSRAPGITARC